MKIIITAKSGAGKDFLLREFIKIGYKPALKWTTRPIRAFEIQGQTYNYVNTETFKKGIEDNIFLTYQSFEVSPLNKEKEIWYYGLTKEEFEKSQVFIMTPEEIKSLNCSEKILIIYLDISREIREQRLIKRQDNNDSISRRLNSDEKDFEGFDKYDIIIKNEKFTIKEILKEMAIIYENVGEFIWKIK